VKKALEGSLDSAPTAGTSQFGELFETFVILEIHRLNQYFEKDFRLSFFRTKHGNEVDLVLTKGRSKILIEIKSSAKVDELQVRSLSRLAKDFGSNVISFYLSQDKIERDLENVKCLHWQSFLTEFKKL
jgi:predicted AAA+ superfamily ATPase